MGENTLTVDDAQKEKIKEKFNILLTDLRIKLVRHSPFYSTLLNNLARCMIGEEEFCWKHRIDTAATDGRHIVFNPQFVENISPAEFNFVIMHELYHVLMGHVTRGKQLGIDKQSAMEWNVACDGAINPLILDLNTTFHGYGLEVAPDNVDNIVLFKDEDDNVREESAETFYAEIHKDNDRRQDDSDGKGNMSGKGGGSGKSAEPSDVFSGKAAENTDDEGGSDDGNGADNADTGDLKADMYDELYDEEEDPTEETLKDYNTGVFKEACQRNRSELSGTMARMYDGMIKKIPVKWSTYLRRFVTAKKADDVSFSTPNRFYLPHGILRPGDCDGEALDNISFYLDTSGSISQLELSTFFDTAYSIADQYKCTISVFLWHTRLYAEYTDIELDDCKKVLASIKPSSGGTCIWSSVRHMVEKNKASLCNVVITDGYTETIAYSIPRFLQRKTIIAVEPTSFDAQSIIDNLKKLGKVVSLT